MIQTSTGRHVMLDEGRIFDPGYLAAQAAALTAVPGAKAALDAAIAAEEAAARKAALDAHSRQDPMAEVAIVYGTQASIEELAANVRLGAAERDRRAARRKQQRASRRANR